MQNTLKLEQLYREGYDDQWAYGLPKSFKDPKDIWRTLNEFMDLCHIVDKPNIQRDTIP